MECECGCGNEVNIVNSIPKRFIKHHHLRTQFGEKNHQWIGGTIKKGAYFYTHDRNHPKANPKGYVYQHILVAEGVLGKHLQRGVVVHHVDHNGQNNNPSNLVVCESLAYHRILHHRENIYLACGNANFVRCKYCKQYDDPVNNMYLRPGTQQGWHRDCHSKYHRERKLNKGR